MNRVSKGIFIAAASLAMTGTAFAQDPADPPVEGEAGAEGEVGAEAGASVETPAGGAAVGAEVSADASMGMYTKETWPLAAVDRPLTLAKGMIEIRGDVFINMSADAVGKPISIAPDIYYGVSDKLSVGVTHGTGICLTGEENGCGKVYDDIGFDANLSLKRDAKIDLALRAGVDLTSFDPLLLSIHVGVGFKYRMNKIAIYVDPSINIGVTERDGVDDGMGGTIGGNKESIGVPVSVGYQATPELAVFLRTGIGGFAGPNPGSGAALLDGFGDNFVIPLGIGALFAVSNKIDVGGEFSFPAIAGSDIASADFRLLTVKVNARF